MRYKLALSFLSAFILLFVRFDSTSAQNSVDTKASVGRFHFLASGIVSPYASVVMTSQGNFLSTTVADSEGNFVLPKALVNDGFNNFCLEATDIKRIGTSYTCFEAEPPTSDFSREDIFLPPTVGLSARRITVNSPLLTSGYSMPEADVTVNVGEGLWTSVKADEDGFYKSEMNEIPKGKYELYATAVYENKSSAKPSKTFTVEVLGLLSSIPSWVYIGILALIALIIILLIILFWRKRRGKQARAKKPSRFQKFFFWRA